MTEAVAFVSPRLKENKKIFDVQPEGKSGVMKP